MGEEVVGYMDDRRNPLLNDRRDSFNRYDAAARISGTVTHCLNQVSMSIPVFLGKLEDKINQEVMNQSKDSINGIVSIGRKSMLYNSFFEVQSKINETIISGDQEKVIQFGSLLNMRALYEKQIVAAYGQEEFDVISKKVMKKGRRSGDKEYFCSMGVADLFMSSLEEYVEKLRSFADSGQYDRQEGSKKLLGELDKIFTVYDSLLAESSTNKLVGQYDSLLKPEKYQTSIVVNQ